MAFISINPEEARKYVNSVSEYASLISKEGKKIHDKSEGNNHPVSTVEAATKPSGIPPHVFVSDPSKPAAFGAASFMGGLQNSAASTMANTIDGHAMQLVSYATEVEYRRLEVVYLNSNGVASYNADGTLSYYLPDPPEGQDPAAYWAKMDTSENVAQYNSVSVENGKDAAKKLEDAVNSGDQAAISKQLEEINKHRDVPAYSSMFCQTMGVPDMMDAPLKMQEMSEEHLKDFPIDSLLDTFGHMMAAASTLYDDSSAQTSASKPGAKKPWNLREQIYNAVVDNPQRATVLDAYMTAKGTVYDSEFLVDLAKNMEKIESWPLDVETEDPRKWGFNSITGRSQRPTHYLVGHSADPLAAVLHGMGNNPEAALNYLSGGRMDEHGNWYLDDETTKRWEMLEKRKWTARTTGAFTSAQAAASAYRQIDSGQAGLPNADTRATWLAGKTISMYSSDKYAASSGNLTDESKKNLALVLANSPEEIFSISTGQWVRPGDGRHSLSNSAEDITKLIYRVSDNEDAATTISANMGAWHHKRIERHLEENKGLSRDERFGVLNSDYGYASETEGFLSRLTEQHYKDNKDYNEERQNKINYTTSVYSAAVTGAIAVATAPASAPVAAGISAATAIAAAAAQPVIASEAASEVADPTAPSGKKKAVPYQDMMEAQAYSHAAHNNLFADEATNKSAAEKGVALKEGESNKVLDSQHTGMVEEWEGTVAKDGSVKQLSDSVGTGQGKGAGHADTYLTGVK